MFHPLVQQWFTAELGVPTAAQRRGWESIRAGRHTLIAAPTGSGKTLAAFLTALDDLFREGLERHIEVEEQVLFPVFEELSGAAHGGPTAVMRAEHTDLRKLMAEVAGVLEMGGAEGLTTPLAALTARIYAHNGKEERILYPMTDRLAREAGTLDDLVSRLRGF